MIGEPVLIRMHGCSRCLNESDAEGFYPAGHEPDTPIKERVHVFTVALPFRVLYRQEQRAEMGAGEVTDTEEVKMKPVDHVDSGCLGIFNECQQSTATD